MAQGLAKAAKRAETPLGDQDANGGSQDLMDQGGQYGSGSLSNLDAKGLKNAGLIASAPAGIVLSTPKHIQTSATENILHTAGNNIHNSAFKKFTVAAGELIRFFAQTIGIKMVAAKGDITLQAQQDNITAAAAKDIRIDSVNGEITISAAKKLTLVCDGSYITIGGGQVEIGTPGQIINKSSAWQKVGPASQSVQSSMPKAAKGQLELHHFYNIKHQPGVKGGKFTVTDSSGQVRTGLLDDIGRAIVSGLAEGAAKVVYHPDPRNGHEEADINKEAFEINSFIEQEKVSDIKEQINQFKQAAESVSFLVNSAKDINPSQALKQLSSQVKTEAVKQVRQHLEKSLKNTVTQSLSETVKHTFKK